jgi:phosphoribosyl-dephospho-CoA transferase
MELSVHDLIRLNQKEDLLTDLPLPAWAVSSLQRAPFVVVRRAAAPDGLVAVGIRGPQRGQRVSAWLKPEGIGRVIKPRALSIPGNWAMDYQDDLLHPVYSLKQIAPILSGKGFDWGPTGSTGFELATGIPAVNEYSDLDIVLNVTIPFNTVTAAGLLEELQAASVSQLDVQLNTPLGGVSLKEYATAPKVLVKTAEGPLLASPPDIWHGLN